MVRSNGALALVFTAPILVPALLLAPGCVGDLPGVAPSPDASTTAETGPSSDATAPPYDAASDASSPATNDASPDGAIANDASPDAPTTNDASPADAGPPSLSTVNGLVLWLRADTGVVASSPSGSVTAWKDQTIHHNDLTVPSGGSSPKYVTNDGGAPWVEFNASPLVNPSPLGIAAGAPRTIVVVARLVSATARAPLFGQCSQQATANDCFMIEANTAGTVGSRYGVFVNGAAFDSAQATSTLGFAVHVLRVGAIKAGDAIAPAVSYRFDGIDTKFTGTTGASSNTPTPTETTMGSLPYSGTYINGSSIIVEAALWDHELSASDTALVETDLKTRYGI